MSYVNDPVDGEFEAANSQLNKGLKTCRSVLENYRSLLSTEPDALTQQSNGNADCGLGKHPQGG